MSNYSVAAKIVEEWSDGRGAIIKAPAGEKEQSHRTKPTFLVRVKMGNLSKSMLRTLGCIFILSCLIAAMQPAKCAAPAAPAAVKVPLSKEDAEEEKLGKKAAEELEKVLKPIKDSPELARLERIANEIAPYTERPKVHYTVKVVTSKAINAISLPGGRIYVTEGTLEAVESDDELAAILAHEIAHNSLRHAMQQHSRAGKADLGLIVAVLAGIATGRGEVTFMAAQIQQGALNHYGRKFELQADEHALNYLNKTEYKPVAMLTVLEGLAAMEASQLMPQGLTTGTTHPLAKDRADNMEKLLVKQGVDITAARRLVTNRFKIEAKPLEKDGKTIAEITLNGKSVFAPAQTENNSTPLQRAQAYAKALRLALNQGLQSATLRVAAQGNDAELFGNDQVLLRVTAGDAAFHKRSAAALAEEAKKAIELALYAEKISRPF
jgi:predicted Zn-dependent protease